MKNRIFLKLAVVLAVSFILQTINVFAYPSREYASKDYRNMQIMNKQGTVVPKPTAQFSANRISGGQVVDLVTSYADYDCNADIPTLTCYVGDTLTFTDMSRANNGGNIVEWDWQRYGALGDSYKVYKNNIVNTESFQLTAEGETTFYLCVKSDTKVKTGSCDPWSENGNHQTVGKNKWFPKGAYWYFTAVRIVVKPVRKAVVTVRYWDAPNNTIIREETVNMGQLFDDAQTVDTNIHIDDMDGYSFSAWNVQLPDGTIQYSGNDKDVQITLAGWVPQKFLNVELYPEKNTGVEVRYWDKAENAVIKQETLTGEKVVGEQETKIIAEINVPDGYTTDGWNVQLPDGTIQYEGTESLTEIALSGYIPKKFLNVRCYPINNKKITVNYIDTISKKIIETELLKPDKSDTDVSIKNISGYVIEDWTLKLPDGKEEKSGNDDPVRVTLTENEPHKILDVNCYPTGSGGNSNDPEPVPPTETIVKPSGICNGIIEWTETDSHRVPYKSGRQTKYRTCRHTFNYKVVLGASAEVTPAVLKSGYGFEVNVNCTLNTSLISQSGGCSNWGRNRKAANSVKNPDKATIYLPWEMTNSLGMQGKTISMVSGGRLKFKLPVSPVSQAGARKIYTPVELSGTKEAPEHHLFEIYISGGGVGGVEFCQKLDETITINGDMYEDDFSGAD